MYFIHSYIKFIRKTLDLATKDRMEVQVKLLLYGFNKEKMIILHSKNEQILPYADILVLISIMRVYFIFKISVVFRNKHCSDCSTVQQCITCITVFRYEHMYISKTWTVLENNSNTTSQALMHTRIQIKGSVKKKQQQKNIVRQQ